MRQITPFSIWIGHFADLNDPANLSNAGIQAIVDLADNEKPTLIFRDVVYCRFPLTDGGGNPMWLLDLAIQTVTSLLVAKTPTLVCCSAGMSRSPSIVAAALARVENVPLDSGLERLRSFGSLDISPSLWGALQKLEAGLRVG